uniref:Uncharacterized protein LOC104219258 n=1 Tax=Nicotiana sylvestris TaxID=4096 RepID=A0A1U7W0P4_NICSY
MLISITNSDKKKTTITNNNKERQHALSKLSVSFSFIFLLCFFDYFIIFFLWGLINSSIIL